MPIDHQSALLEHPSRPVRTDKGRKRRMWTAFTAVLGAVVSLGAQQPVDTTGSWVVGYNDGEVLYLYQPDRVRVAGTRRVLTGLAVLRSRQSLQGSDVDYWVTQTTISCESGWQQRSRSDFFRMGSRRPTRSVAEYPGNDAWSPGLEANMAPAVCAPTPSDKQRFRGPADQVVAALRRAWPAR